MNKLVIVMIGLLTAASAFSQNKNEVDLNWKIQPSETLSYKTVMTEIDTSAVQFNFGNLYEALVDSSDNKVKEAKDLFKQLNESLQNIDLVTELTTDGDGIVDIEMKTLPKEPVSKTDTTKVSAMLKMMQSVSQGVVLRGSVYDTGDIHSFWVKSDQKNLIAIFFQLPTKPVKLGDSWQLDVDLIGNDQNFECDSAYKINKVTMVDLKEQNGEKIAVLKYKVEEFVDGIFNSPAMFGSGGPTPTTMHLTFQAMAEFSIDKGRWISFDGIMGLSSSGVMQANSKKNFSLIAN